MKNQVTNAVFANQKNLKIKLRKIIKTPEQQGITRFFIKKT